MKKILFRILFLLFFFSTFSVSSRVNPDSLIAVLPSTPEKEKPALLNQLAAFYRSKDPLKCQIYALQAVEISKKYSDYKNLGDAFNNLGGASYTRGDYKKAISHFTESLRAREKLNDSASIANSLNNLGVMYRRLFQFDSAQHFYMRSLEIREKLGNKEDIYGAVQNLGGFFYYQRNYPKALEYYFKAERIGKELEDSAMLAKCYLNLMLVFTDMDSLDVAIRYGHLATGFSSALGIQQDLGLGYNNMGRIYERKKDFHGALNYYRKAISIFQETGDEPNLHNPYYNLGSVYRQMNDYSKAIEYYSRSLELSRLYGNRLLVRDNYFGLAASYFNTGNPSKAYSFLLDYIDLNDSLYNEESLSRQYEMEVKYQSEMLKVKAEKLQKEKEMSVIQKQAAEATRRKDNIIKWISVAGFSIILVISVLLFYQFRRKKKDAELLELQRDEIATKNKDIMDSIDYAGKIQTAILPPEEKVKQFIPGSFIFFKPKDVVSGDFFWVEMIGLRDRGEVKDSDPAPVSLFAAADCTGHGVPGALMSIIGNNALNKAVRELRLNDPARILDEVNRFVSSSLSQDFSNEGMQDGMDIALCSVDYHNMKAGYSGAYNPLWLVRKSPEIRVTRNGEPVDLKPSVTSGDYSLFEMKADKIPVGGYEAQGKKFSLWSFDLKKGDNFYVFTDGFADQFGGPDGKKFKYRNLQKLLISSSALSPVEQKENLETTLGLWKGLLEQVDDVLVIGMQF